MSDLISRQAVIDAINALHEKPNAWLDSAVDAVMTLPSAQPERKKGRWILVHEADENGNALYECSVCHKGETHVPTVDVSYCWNCGARMEGESDE